MGGKGGVSMGGRGGTASSEFAQEKLDEGLRSSLSVLRQPSLEESINTILSPSRKFKREKCE